MKWSCMEPELFSESAMEGRKPLDWTMWNAVKARILASILEDEKKRPKTWVLSLMVERK